LYALLYESNPVIRTFAARELQIRNDLGTYEKSVEMSKDKRVYVREMAAFVLGQLGAPSYPYKRKSVPVLIELASDRSSSVRATAVSALGHLKALKARSVIINAANDSSAQVRVSAAFSLRMLPKSPESDMALLSLKKDKSREVRSSVEW
jgi:HEAT repeat protein